jgi:hypothetical protein
MAIFSWGKGSSQVGPLGPFGAIASIGAFANVFVFGTSASTLAFAFGASNQDRGMIQKWIFGMIVIDSYRYR